MLKRSCHVIACSKTGTNVFKGQPPANTLQVDLLCCLLNVFKDIIIIHVCFEKWMSWFNPSWQLSSTELLAHYPLMGWGESQISTSKKTCGLRLRQFYRESKRCPLKQSWTSTSVPPWAAGIQLPPRQLGSIMCNGYLGRQTSSLHISPTPFLLLPPTLYTENGDISYRMPLLSVRVNSHQGTMENLGQSICYRLICQLITKNRSNF